MDLIAFVLPSVVSFKAIKDSSDGFKLLCGLESRVKTQRL